MYLLDTHALIWAVDDFSMLSQVVSDILQNEQNVFVSIASFWEIAIKKSNGKLEFKRTIEQLKHACDISDFEILPILPSHLDLIETLPFLHKDPFDRLLIAQAQAENFTLITKDEIIPKYDVKTLW